jgi:hypothetical protein
MWNRKIFIASIILLILLVSSMTLVGAEAPFSVSPGEFTVRDAPPLGESYTIPETIIVWNRDNIERLIFVTSEIPPENAVSAGYEPIPNENWVTPFPSSVLINENSFAVIQLSFNIPRWENLTGQKWEVWIPVERQALPGEPIVYRPAVRIKIETTKELPPVSKGINYLVLLAAGLLIAMVVISVGIWYKMRPRRGRARVLV